MGPKVLKDLLEEYKDFFPNSIPQPLPKKGVQLFVALIDGVETMQVANVPVQSDRTKID